MRYELKPCPFCGVSEVYSEGDFAFGWKIPEADSHEHWYILCLNDECDVVFEITASNEADAVEMWNTRPEPVPAITPDYAVIVAEERDACARRACDWLEDRRLPNHGVSLAAAIFGTDTKGHE